VEEEAVDLKLLINLKIMKELVVVVLAGSESPFQVLLLGLQVH
tara:strand:+ start:27 stop:155 length:129 start_codon:yes stop_codon:yes gene_type:complete